jgi:hypothetical protein
MAHAADGGGGVKAGQLHDLLPTSGRQQNSENNPMHSSRLQQNQELADFAKFC